MLRRIFGVACVMTLTSMAFGDTFNVSNPAEFQAALNTAQSNGVGDTINVAAGAYDIGASGTLTYTAAATENFGLTIDGGSSTAVTLDGGSQVQIMRIDTTAVVNDGGVFINVFNMTFQNGNIGATPGGGALLIVTDDTQQPPQFATLVGLSGSEFYGNATNGDGGAVYIRAHAVEGIYINDVTFEGNSATGDGGALYVAGGVFTTPIFVTDIDFFTNTAAGSGGGLAARGFDFDTPSEERARSVDLFDITFRDNQSTSLSGSGGGADVAALTLRVDRVGFVDNDARRGGGLNVRDNFSQIAMVNTGFTGNDASEDGGGMAAGVSVFADIVLANNTIYGNTANGEGAGAIIEIDGSSSIARISNNIIYNNVSSQGIDDDLRVNNNAIGDIAAIVEIFNNDLSNFGVNPGPFAADFNIDADPMLVDIAARPDPDPRLMAGSPAIDAGDGSLVGVPTQDFEADARPFDGVEYDIGMDEFTGAVVQNADLSVTKGDSPDPVIEGSNITYTVVVANNGPGGATNVVLTDTLDSLVSFVSATPSVGTCDENAGVVTCAIGTLANNASTTVTIVVATPDVPQQVVITNTATVAASEADQIPGNNTATETTTIIPAGPAMADLALTKNSAPNPVFSGGPQITYLLSVTNRGPNDATGVVLTDTLPAGVVFDSVTTSTGTCSEANAVVTCNIGALATDANADVSIVVTPDVVTTATVITNTATVAAVEMDPTPGNDTASVDTTVNPPSSDLGIATSSTPSQPLINEQITYTVTVNNAGPSDNGGVEVVVTLPPMVTFESVNIDQGSCAVDNGTVTCTIGDIAAGASVVARVIVTAPGAAMTVTLSALVTADVGEPNSVSEDIVIIDVIDLVIEGQTKGGSFGWFELLFLLAAVGILAVRAGRKSNVPGALALLPALLVATSAAVLVSPADAHAQEDWYVGATIGETSLDYSASDLTRDLANLGWTINNPKVDDSNTTWKVYGGFKVNSWFAIEAGYADLGEVVTRFGATIPPNQIDALLNDTLSVHPYQGDGWLANAAFTWTLVPDRFALVGRVGLFLWESETDVRVVSGGTGAVADDDSGTDAMFGAGLEWRLNDRWALTADWERYKLNEWLDVPSIGVKFSF